MRVGGYKATEAGAELDLERAEAKRLLESGQAEPVAEKPVRRAEKRPAAKKAERR